jgi:hypothetical protein
MGRQNSCSPKALRGRGGLGPCIVSKDLPLRERWDLRGGMRWTDNVATAENQEREVIAGVLSILLQCPSDKGLRNIVAISERL